MRTVVMKGIAFGVLSLVASSAAPQASAAPAGASCATAIPFAGNTTYVSDTTTTTNWMNNFGPLLSLSNDQLYMFTAGPPPLGTITPTAASYLFAMYLIDSCADGGSEPPPIRATATVGSAIDLSNVTEGHVYYVAVTGTAAGGAGANGTVSFGIDGLEPVALQTFTVD